MRRKSLLVLVAAAGLLVGAFPWLTFQSESLPSDVVVDRIVVSKNKRILTVYARDRALKSYRIALGFSPRGAKRFQGDGRTPEGSYEIDSRNDDSAFHLALHVSYPNAADRAFAKRQGKDPGGAIMIHGLGNRFEFLGPLHRTRDWTDGCIAVTNREIEELWRAVPDGTPIELRP